MAVTYMTLPSVQQFKKDSSVFLADRSRDKVLLELDKLLAEYPSINGANPNQTRIKQQIQLARLWFACDYWLKIVDGGKRYPESANMNSSRRPAIYELYKCIVKTLVDRTGVPVNKLADWLMVTFGRGMSVQALETDRRGHATYLCPEDLRWYRLHFNAGRAYQHKWWDNSSELVLADSQHSLMDATADAKAKKEGLSGYAVSLGRDFYLSRHFVSNNSDNSFYHSSYLGGQTVLCAGTIKITNGEVQLITNDSGHYRPLASHLAQTVEALGVFGVRLDKLEVRAFGLPQCSGDAFVLKVMFDLNMSQAEELKRELARVTAMKKTGDEGRRMRVENAKTIKELADHLKSQHGGKRGFKCDTCKRYADSDLMKVALWALANKKIA